ncbi:hypothetical protein [Acidimicrobium ferrooxidans]|uniref:hypothetical protein n=1 Tax=Acidimicrobium ferrooxidans TaxID=53635 RepID=UPI00117F0218|nr:hypothetical protein [Acidimicrobium ferrooxidans]
MSSFDERQPSALGWEGVDQAPSTGLSETDQHVFWVEVGDRIGEGLGLITARSEVAEVELIVGPGDEHRTVAEPVGGAPSNWGDFGDLGGVARDDRDDEPRRLVVAATEPTAETGTVAAVDVVTAPLMTRPRRSRWRTWSMVLASVALIVAARLLLFVATTGGRHP